MLVFARQPPSPNAATPEARLLSVSSRGSGPVLYLLLFLDPEQRRIAQPSLTISQRKKRKRLALLKHFL